MYKKTKLSNGLKVITHRMPSKQSVSLGIWIKTGGRYEPAQVKGVAHFIEHLLFKGSKKYSCRKIKESIEGIGGSLNGFTSEEVTCYLVKIPATYLNLAMDILSDMVINPLFLPADIEKERTVILEEIKMYKDLPQSYVHELLDGLMWPKQPLGESILGTFETILRMKKNDLATFKKQYYTPPNIVLSAAGALDHSQLVSRARHIFSGRCEKKMNGFLKAEEIQVKPQLEIFYKETEQAHLALGFHSFKRGHPLKHALGLLNIILGGNMSSRLFNEVREKRGLSYEIGTQLKRFEDTGAFLVHAGMDNKKVIPAIKLILEELSRAKAKVVTEDEFRRAKDFYLGQLMLALEDTMDSMLWIGETTVALDKAYTLEEIIKEVRSVKRHDLQEAAKQVFKENNLNLALIGPLKNKEAEISGILRLN
ncbi:MAG: insulinase family protein [Candidatus Omnitrophica bacterium]|jgi:predicted Zn-dependent peptidase|nr:insulinase family protein [Candidatus Omnitrophota bacterium]